MKDPSVKGSNSGKENPHGFKISLGSIEDIDLLIEHRLKMWEDIHPERLSQILESRKETSEWIRERIVSGKYISFIARDPQGKVAGTGAILLRDEPPKPGRKNLELPYLLSMYTEKEYRRMGVATLIAEEAIRWAREHKYYRIYLHTSQFADELYEKLGFKAANERRLELEEW